MPDKWYESQARSSCTGVSLRWVAGAVDDTLIHVLSGAIEVTALKYGHVPRAVGIRMHLSGFGRTAAHAPAFSGAHYVASSDGEVDLYLKNSAERGEPSRFDMILVDGVEVEHPGGHVWFDCVEFLGADETGIDLEAQFLAAEAKKVPRPPPPAVLSPPPRRLRRAYQEQRGEGV